MNHYQHLTPKEREFIMISHHDGLSISEISRLLNRNKSTISRELKRNTINNTYSAIEADELYKIRRKVCRPKKKLDDPNLFSLVKTLFLDHQWSPEEIENRLRFEKSKYSISYSTIYRGIYARLFDEPNLSHGNQGAIRKLRHRGKSRHTKDYIERRGKIQISHLIDERPIEANNRKRIGDWEADTVAGVTGKACFVTLVDRKSRFLIAEKINKKTSEEVKSAMIKIFNEHKCLSITPDRGKEFSKHKEMAEILNIEFYFPLPHHPWQRGTNENTNGLLREYFPKNTDITDISNEWIQAKINELNKRPRKCLDWKTPYEVYYGKELHLI